MDWHLKETVEDYSTRAIDIRREIRDLKKALEKFQETKGKPQEKNTKPVGLETLESTLSSMRVGPDLFVQLLKSRIKVRLKIPETLLFLPSYIFPIFLYNDSNGFIAYDFSEHSVDNFHQKVRELTQDYPERYPKYIHIPYKKSPSTFFDWESAFAIFDSCPSYTHHLQRYLMPQTSYPSKIRYHWSSEKPPKSYCITSLCKIPEEFVVDYRDPQKSHIICSFQHIPELQATLRAVKNLFVSKLQDNFAGLQDLVVDFFKDTHKDWIFLGCKFHRLRGDNAEKLQSLAREVDFEKNVFDRSHFHIDIPQRKKIVKFAEHSRVIRNRNHSQHNVPAFIDHMRQRGETTGNSLGKLDGKKMQEQLLKSYLELRNSDSIGRIPLNMLKLNPGASKRKLVNFIERNRPSVFGPSKHKDRLKNAFWGGNDKLPPGDYAELASKQLDDVSKTFDKKLRAAEYARRDLAKKKRLSEALARYPSLIKVVEQFVVDMMHDPILSYHFEHQNIHEIKSKTAKIYSCIDPKTSLGARMYLSKTHLHLGISSKEFDVFISLLYKKLAKIPEDDKALIIEAFVQYKECIVDPKHSSHLYYDKKS